MVVNNPDHRKLTKTLMYMDNMSFDPVHEVSARLGLTVNAVSSALERPTAIQGNASFVLGYDGSGNLTSFAKTVGATTYTKTLGWTSSLLTSISTWS